MSEPKPTPLRFPGKVLADEAGGRLFIADSNHNRIVVCSLDGRLIDTIGSGSIGMTNGNYKAARFNHPQGMALAGDILYVADYQLREGPIVSTNALRLMRSVGIDLDFDSVAPRWEDPKQPVSGSERPG